MRGQSAHESPASRTVPRRGGAQMTAIGPGPARPGDERVARRRRRLTRAIPVAALAIAAFVVGIIVSGGSGRAERATVRQYVTAWQGARYGEMYSLLDSGSRR